MLCGPNELNVHVSAAVPPAPAKNDAAVGTTATGLPIGVLPSENVTVPVAPVALLLADEMHAVRVIFVPAVTVDALAVKAVAVVAFETVTVSVTGVATAL